MTRSLLGIGVLLAVAVRHDGWFVTLDRRIDPAVVEGAGPAHLKVL